MTDPGSRPFQASGYADGGAERVTFRRSRPARGSPARPGNHEGVRAVPEHHVAPAGAVLAQPPDRRGEPARRARHVPAERQGHRPDQHRAGRGSPSRRPPDHGRPGPQRRREHGARIARMAPSPVSHRSIARVCRNLSCHACTCASIFHARRIPSSRSAAGRPLSHGRRGSGPSSRSAAGRPLTPVLRFGVCRGTAGRVWHDRRVRRPRARRTEDEHGWPPPTPASPTAKPTSGASA